MSACVVDASVAAKWFLPEEHSAEALSLLNGRHRLLAPDLIHAEFGSIIWKQHRRDLLDAGESVGRIHLFLKVPLQILPAKALLPKALALAVETGRTVYDCLYLALAMREGCEMITADRRLVNALADGPLERYVRGVWQM